MPPRTRTRGPLTALLGAVLLSVLVPGARGQDQPPPGWAPATHYSGVPCLPPRQPQLPGQPGQFGQPSGQPAQPGQEASQQQAPQQPQQQAATGPDQAAEQGRAVGGEAVAVSAPNMVGDFLGAGRSVSFDYNRGGSGVLRVFNSGSTSVVNPKVADDNSPLPQDRIGFRYNYFHDSLAVTGIGDQSTAAVINSAGLPLQSVATTTRQYDVNQYTFQFEKTFLDGLTSVEFRLPFQNTLSSNLDLRAGTVTGITSIPNPGNLVKIGPSGGPVPIPADMPLQALTVDPTSDETLGNQRTELGNISLIFKGLFYRTQAVALSGGLGVGIPTANNERVRVTDYGGILVANILEFQRIREFDVKNETWGLSPFVAALYTPNDRFFAQGFLQFDVPLNTSRVTYTETAPLQLNTTMFSTTPTDPTTRVPPFTATDRLREQALMHIDVGTGYWVVRDPQAAWLNGLAPTLELHYTTTLNNADIVTLPRDGVAVPIQSFFDPVKMETINTRSENQPTVGNRRNRVDILDLTAGTTFLIANRATLATAFAVPLRNGDDRTFNWEFQLQLNYYFGGVNRRDTFAPTF